MEGDGQLAVRVTRGFAEADAPVGIVTRISRGACSTDMMGHIARPEQPLNGEGDVNARLFERVAFAAILI